MRDYFHDLNVVLKLAYKILVRFACKMILKLIEISFYSSAKIGKCGKMESYSGFCIFLYSF